MCWMWSLMLLFEVCKILTVCSFRNGTFLAYWRQLPQELYNSLLYGKISSHRELDRYPPG